MSDEEFAELQRRADERHARRCVNCYGYEQGHGDLLWPGPERLCFKYEPQGHTPRANANGGDRS
ncbi:hypothetical protein HW130_03300 [Streptomyces sp. PKU-EA00015]|uniref:hypothetical protein n=1 Tax=Streptomyces sp. PKU-EA00015 TaxID=2748326 RepID=UPI0015A282C5|nr:hypothetical protein [Streptomyces sp. PKU-EA00015]NWF25299.1 hypothetical protein [Streptomyces sp. PKU-EA00015]